MPKHQSEKRSAIRQQETRVKNEERGREAGREAPEGAAAGKGKPDAEEGVGTVQNQKR